MPRKKPFSGKQKKHQLQAKKERKAQKSLDEESGNSRQKQSKSLSDSSKQSAHDRASGKGEYNPNRYNLNFLHETREELNRRKHEAQTVPIKFVSEYELEVDIKDVYKPGSVLDMPKRPKWKYGITKNQLEQSEEAYFQKYLDSIHKNFEGHQLSYFEHNLETWRQAWRVIEMCDILVMVTDVRHPVLHFSPALYQYVIEDFKKPLILVLNKIDLVPASVIAAWTSYFKRLFPHLHVVWFTSFPQDSRTVEAATKVKTKRGPKKRVYSTQIGPKELLHTCREICGNKVDFSSWELKIESDLQKLGFISQDSSPLHVPGGGDATKDEIECDVEEGNAPNKENDLYEKELKIEDGVLTIGFVGHPNVGKSSLMNGLIGRKVVSTSVTPGHTKYFQTYFLTKTIKLCDSPGLVFPSLIPKQMQILSGIYPIAQVQEPYTPVGFLAARIPLVELLRIQYPTHGLAQPYEGFWTPWDICEAWADKRNYRTAKAARPDVYRAANAILRMAVDGRLCLYMRPPGYTNNKAFWLNHEYTNKLLALQGNAAAQQPSTGTVSSMMSFSVDGDIVSSSDSAPNNDMLDDDLSICSESTASEGSEENMETLINTVDELSSDSSNEGTTSLSNKFAALLCTENN